MTIAVDFGRKATKQNKSSDRQELGIELGTPGYKASILGSHLTAVSYKRKYVHEVLVTCLFKLAQEKVWLVELTVPTWHDHSC